ncbi:MAG: triose-phosphate isomerase [bacterium]|nr:triose-phosphate isomerase [bacterium]
MKPLIVANWKCNPTTLEETKALFNSVGKGIKKIKNVEVVICPPFVYLSNLKSKILNLKLGAQDCFWEQKGAYTGEVSPKMLKDIGCQYVILGHSERRIYLGETDEMINKKIKLVLKAKLNPVLCIGETEEERNQGRTQEVLKNQLISAFLGISKSIIQNSKFSIAYEPIWAIGTRKACEVNEAQTMSLFIRKIIAQLYGSLVSKKVQILYGGSINSKNALSYIKEARMQGLLVGGASLDHQEFIKLVKNISRGRRG